MKWIDTRGLFQNGLHDEARGSDVNYRLIGDGIQQSAILRMCNYAYELFSPCVDYNHSLLL